MKAKVNPTTGMVALVALAGMMNVKEGAVFGALPKDAARLISKKAAKLLPEAKLPEKIKDWKIAELNIEAGTAAEGDEISEAAKT